MQVLDELLDIIEPIRRSGTLVDLFSGSGVVSFALSTIGKVASCDIQEYSRVLVAAELSAARPTQHEISAFLSTVDEFLANCVDTLDMRRLLDAERDLLTFERDAATALPLVTAFGSIASDVWPDVGVEHEILRELLRVKSKFLSLPIAERTRHAFLGLNGGRFFSYAQALELEALWHACQTLAACKREPFVAALLTAASTCANTIGNHFAQPIQAIRRDQSIKTHLVEKMKRDRLKDVRKSFTAAISWYRNLEAPSSGHIQVQGDYRTFLDSYREQVGLIYADPPYTRDHYSRFYHALEFLSLTPGSESIQISEALMRQTRAGYLVERHQSPFCIKSKVEGAFRDLFEGARRHNCPLVVSYSDFDANQGERPRLVKLDRIAEIGSEFYEGVHLRPLSRGPHSRMNRTDLNVRPVSKAEVVFIFKP